MAFITCKSCGEQTSDARKKCPNCGRAIVSVADQIKAAHRNQQTQNEIAQREQQREQQEKRDSIRCPNCKFQGTGKKVDKGSGGIELALWLLVSWFTFLIVPVVYSIWRRSGERRAQCPVCGWAHVVPLALEGFHQDPDPEGGEYQQKPEGKSPQPSLRKRGQDKVVSIRSKAS